MGELPADFENQAAYQGKNRCPTRISSLGYQYLAAAQFCGFAWVERDSCFAANTTTTGSSALEDICAFLFFGDRLAIRSYGFWRSDSHPVVVGKASICNECVQVLGNYRGRVGFDNRAYLVDGQKEHITWLIQPTSSCPALAEVSEQSAHREDKLGDMVPAVVADGDSFLR